MKRDKSLARLFLLTVLLLVVFIYANQLTLREVTFDIFGYTLLTGILVYPLTFYIANLITHSYKTIDTIRAVVITVVIQFLYIYVSGNTAALELILSISLAFLIAQAANLYVVEDLLKRETKKYSDWFMLYVLIFILDNIIYIAMMSNYTSILILSIPVFLSIIIKCIIAAFLGLSEVLVITKK